MTEREIADWEREIRHAEKMQEQRKSKSEGWDGKNPPKTWVENIRTGSAWTYLTSHSEQFNED